MKRYHYNLGYLKTNHWIYRKMKHMERETAWRNPVLLNNGRLQRSKGPKWYILPYFILSRRPLTEKELVSRMLYFICGVVAVGLMVI